MKKGIVIATSEFTKDFFKDCLASVLPTQYSILVVSNNDYVPDVPFGIQKVINPHNGFELGAIDIGARYFDEFVFLHDTCVIKDRKLFDLAFDCRGSMSFSPSFFHYMGKYRSVVVAETGVPKVTDKEEAIRYETEWTAKYAGNEARGVVLLDPPLPVVSETFEELHGRRNMVVENIFIKKFKATFR